MDVHKVAMDVLKSEGQEKRLVSLVGCPGTGKTLCGWLVCYSLHNEGKKTLHLTIRGNEVIAVSAFKTKKIYQIAEWNFFMLREILTETKCNVCIMDVGVKSPQQTNEIFTGVRTGQVYGSGVWAWAEAHHRQRDAHEKNHSKTRLVELDGGGVQCLVEEDEGK